MTKNNIRIKPLVSFIIAVDSICDVSDECIGSIFNQSESDPLEVIVVVLRPEKDFLKTKFDSIDGLIVIRSNKGIYLSQAYNQALMKSKGEFVCFLTGRDVLSKNIILNLKKEFHKGDINIAVIPLITFIDATEKEYLVNFDKNYYHDKFQPNKNQILNSNTVICLSNKIFSRNFLLKFNIFFTDESELPQIDFILKSYFNSNYIVGLNNSNIKCTFNHIVDSCNIEYYRKRYINIVTKSNYLSQEMKNKLLKIDNRNFFHLMKGCIAFKSGSREVNTIASYSVAVIVPTFNTEAYVFRCINSIIRQSLNNIQIIIINDGSVDSSLKTILPLALNHDNIYLVDVSVPSGHPGVARNLGFCIVNADYVGFVDSDDWIDENMMYDLYNFACKNNLDICSTSGYFRVVNEDVAENHQFSYIGKNQTDNFDFLSNRFFSNIWNRIYKTDLLKNNGIYFPSLYLSEDFCFSAIAHYFANKCSSVNNSYYYYRYNLPESTTRQRQGAKGFLILEDFDDQLKYIENFKLPEDFFMSMLQKQLDSFWYTHDRLDLLLRLFFKIELQKILWPFVKRFQYDRLSPDSRGRLKSLLSRKFNQDDLIWAKKGIDLYYLKLGRNFQISNNYALAKSQYDLISDNQIRLFNCFAISMMSGNIIEAKLYKNKLYNFHYEYNACEEILLKFYENYNNSNIEYNIKDNNILLSVIIPVYNSEKYLHQCLKSVLNQSYRNLEIIIVNDGSSDGSADIINKYKELDERIVVINRECASGNPGKPRNDAINIAKGFYITFVDSDDFLSVNYYENFIKTVKQTIFYPDIVFASGYYDCTDGKGLKKIEYENNNFDNKMSIFYRYHQSFTIWDKIYKTSFIRDNNIYLAELPAAVDVPFIFKCYIEAKLSTFCNDNYGYYYRRESDISVTKNKRKSSDCLFEFQAYDELMSWVNKDLYRLHFKPIIDLKKISSYLYTLNLIDKKYRRNFYEKARFDMLCFNKELMLELLLLLGQKEKAIRFKKILEIPFD